MTPEEAVICKRGFSSMIHFSRHHRPPLSSLLKFKRLGKCDIVWELYTRGYDYPTGSGVVSIPVSVGWFGLLRW